MANVKLAMQGCTECVVDVSVPINFTLQKPNFTHEATFIRNGFKVDFFLFGLFYTDTFYVVFLQYIIS